MNVAALGIPNAGDTTSALARLAENAQVGAHQRLIQIEIARQGANRRVPRPQGRDEDLQPHVA
jgi:hypothetical protein